MKRFLLIMISALLLSSVTSAVDILRFSGELGITEPEQTAAEFCGQFTTHNACYYADWKDNEPDEYTYTWRGRKYSYRRSAYDCMRIYGFSIEKYNECRLDGLYWWKCYSSARDYQCVERGAD